MKWTSKETWTQRAKRREKWHPWFAWYPVRLNYNGPTEDEWLGWDSGQWVWLETVERQIVDNMGWNVTYHRLAQ